MKKIISISGSDGDDECLYGFALEVAEKIGRLVAQRGAVLACGGHSGIMKAACKGAKLENGITIGIMPYGKEEANEYIDIAIPTNIGNVRNFLVANSGDAVIAIGGRWGTLNEISFCMISEKPLILVKGTGGCVDKIIDGHVMQDVESNYYVANSAEEAVEKAFELQ
ncbi:MAG: TIGR00725 family protein [Thermoplasmatales archaeon]|nr:MAG: TIGR00725 family protein [Thermoplasmatales archaeon]